MGILDNDKSREESHIPKGRKSRAKPLRLSTSDGNDYLKGSIGRNVPAANFHLSVKTVSRSNGRSATAAIAYRTGSVITDEKTGLVHDYSRRGGVIWVGDPFLPPGAPHWASDREILWNEAEKAEHRKNSTVAREWEVAIPYGLSLPEAIDLASDFSDELVERYDIAVDVAIHQDHSKDAFGVEKNSVGFHAHILGTTRRLTSNGFGEKTRELDSKVFGRKEILHARERWAVLSNRYLERGGHESRIDHRAHRARGIDYAPGKHLGPAAVEILRRGAESDKGRRVSDWQSRYNADQIAMVEKELAALKGKAEKLPVRKKQADSKPAPEAPLQRSGIAQAMAGLADANATPNEPATPSKTTNIRDSVAVAMKEAEKRYPADLRAQAQFVAGTIFPGSKDDQARYVDNVMRSLYVQEKIRAAEEHAAKQYPDDVAAQAKFVAMVKASIERTRDQERPVPEPPIDKGPECS